MADQKVGGVYYEVAADVSNIIELQSKVADATKTMSTQFKDVDKAVKQFTKGTQDSDNAATALKASVAALSASVKAVADTANQASTASTELARRLQVVSESAGRAAAASAAITSALQSQRDSVTQYINKLKEENDTLGLNAQELAQYQAAKLGASEKDKQIIANITAQIEAYRKNAAAVEENARAAAAAKASQDATRAGLDQMIKSLQFQAATVGKSTRELILYKAAQEGATAADRKAIIQSLNTIEAYERKVAATRRAQEAQMQLSKTSEAVQGSFRNLRGVAGNLGFQLQDIAVQAQAGASAFVILGQQGSQVASAFGPGGAVLGAVIAVAAAIGGVLFSSLQKTTEEIRDQFIPTVDDMKEKLDELSKSQAELAIIQIKKELEPLGGIARIAGARIEYLKKQIEKYPNNTDVVKWNEELTEQEALLDGVNQKIIKLNDDQTAFNAIIKRNIEGTQGQQEAEKERITTLGQLIATVQAQAAVVGMTERGIALYTAERLNATQAELAAINAAYDVIEAEKSKQEQTKRNTEELKAYQKAVEDSFLAELKAEQDQRRTVTTEFQQVATSAATDLESPAQRAERELAERLAVIKDYAQQEYADKEAALAAQLAAEQAYSEKLKAIKQDEGQFISQQNMNTLSAVGDFFGNLASIAEQGGKDQFAAWKLLASAQAGISAALAVLNVLANPNIPYPLNIGLAGSIAALAGAQVAQIQSAQYSGGRMYGGPVSPGNVYQVGENNSPELLQQGNKQYLIPGNRGSVTSNADMVGGGMNVSVNVQNYSGQPVDVQRGQTGSGTNAQEVINIVVGNINQRGQIHQSIVRSTTAGNRTT